MYWLTIPLPRQAQRAPITAAINATIRAAAAGVAGVTVVLLDRLFTPDGYRDSMRYRGHTVRVRDVDGLHLSLQGQHAAALTHNERERTLLLKRAAALPDRSSVNGLLDRPRGRTRVSAPRAGAALLRRERRPVPGPVDGVGEDALCDVAPRVQQRELVAEVRRPRNEARDVRQSRPGGVGGGRRRR